MPRPDPSTTRALNTIHARRGVRVPPNQLVKLLNQRLVTLDPTGAITLTRRGRHALHTAKTRAARDERIPRLARALRPVAHEIRLAVTELSTNRSKDALARNAAALTTLASAARHLWTPDERTLLKSLANHPNRLAATAKNLGWTGERAHKTLHRILQHTQKALAHARNRD